jgi:hypothetical protein
MYKCDYLIIERFWGWNWREAQVEHKSRKTRAPQASRHDRALQAVNRVAVEHVQTHVIGELQVVDLNRHQAKLHGGEEIL